MAFTSFYQPIWNIQPVQQQKNPIQAQMEDSVQTLIGNIQKQQALNMEAEKGEEARIKAQKLAMEIVGKEKVKAELSSFIQENPTASRALYDKKARELAVREGMPSKEYADLDKNYEIMLKNAYSNKNYDQAKMAAEYFGINLTPEKFRTERKVSSAPADSTLYYSDNGEILRAGTPRPTIAQELEKAIALKQTPGPAPYPIPPKSPEAILQDIDEEERRARREEEKTKEKNRFIMDLAEQKNIWKELSESDKRFYASLNREDQQDFLMKMKQMPKSEEQVKQETEKENRDQQRRIELKRLGLSDEQIAQELYLEEFKNDLRVRLKQTGKSEEQINQDTAEEERKLRNQIILKQLEKTEGQLKQEYDLINKRYEAASKLKGQGMSQAQISDFLNMEAQRQRVATELKNIALTKEQYNQQIEMFKEKETFKSGFGLDSVSLPKEFGDISKSTTEELRSKLATESLNPQQRKVIEKEISFKNKLDTAIVKRDKPTLDRLSWECVKGFRDPTRIGVKDRQGQAYFDNHFTEFLAVNGIPPELPYINNVRYNTGKSTLQFMAKKEAVLTSFVTNLNKNISVAEKLIPKINNSDVQFVNKLKQGIMQATSATPELTALKLALRNIAIETANITSNPNMVGVTSERMQSELLEQINTIRSPKDLLALIWTIKKETNNRVVGMHDTEKKIQDSMFNIYKTKAHTFNKTMSQNIEPMPSNGNNAILGKIYVAPSGKLVTWRVDSNTGKAGWVSAE